jgi:predicted molibdopterin-dependent oxidoreductase YjgC
MSRRLTALQELRRLRERRAEARLAQALAELEQSRRQATAAREAADQTAQQTAAEARDLTEGIRDRHVSEVGIAAVRARLEAHVTERHSSEQTHAAAEAALARQAGAVADAKTQLRERNKARARLETLADTLSQRRMRADEQKAENEADEQSLLAPAKPAPANPGGRGA